MNPLCECVVCQPADVRWHSINQAELERVIRDFKIERPITIDAAMPYGDPSYHGATHQGRYQADILINPELDARRANVTLLHELVHVAQYDRVGEPMLAHYQVEQALVGYWDNSYEVEAREVSARLASQYSLVS